MLDAVELELRGRPTVTIVEERFETMARLLARGEEMPLLPLLVEPTPEGGAIGRSFPDHLVDVAVRALTQDIEHEEQPSKP